MLFKRIKICYNVAMQSKFGNNKISSLLGEPTRAKASGLTYSLSAVMAVAVAFVFLFILTVLGVNVETGQEPDWYLYCNYALTSLAFVLTAAFIVRWNKMAWKEELKAQKCAPKYYLLAVLLQIGLLSLSELNTLFLNFLAKFGYVDTPIRLPSLEGFGFFGVLLVVALLPALFEEIIFRGFLLKGMGSFGTVGAVLLCGGLFSLYHQNPAQTLYQFCCGAAFALVAVRSGSILPTVLSHFINNALIITLQKFGVTAFSPTVFVLILIVSALCLAGSLIWLVFFEKRTLETGDKGNEKMARKEFLTFAALGIGLCALTWLSVLLTNI